MLSPRHIAIETIGKRQSIGSKEKKESVTQRFGIHVFNRNIMQKVLPREIYRNILNAIEGNEKIKDEYADSIAVAMKEWAIGLGATHYTHWFHPLTGASAEKHDAFIDWHPNDQIVEKFSGKQLVQGEPDASSFPSGGLRSTFEARGYTGWDPSSPVFVWKAGDGITLCIPSIFFSWTGDVLDTKIPLLRSDRKINDAVCRLLRLTGLPGNRVFSTIGLEQEYFVIDRALRNLRPDLLLSGRTVFGAPSPKGQELQDHYFGSVKERILCFMHDFEKEALKLGIPLKTRHNEVAPAQHEVAPIVEKASAAIDHNIQLMELMRKVAVRHNLAVLLHEKPFGGLNGSGKHCNWSLGTDTEINLLDPSSTPDVPFLILLTAILHAVHEHAELLRASIGSAGNDCRLGGHEAPPAIISVYLGEALEGLLGDFEKGNITKSVTKGKYDLGISGLPDLSKDNTDRNRTSPFAFTGNKFEFRALGSSSNPAFPVTVLNVVVASSLNKILDEIEGKMSSKQSLLDAMAPVVRKYLKASKDIRFSGDNYSKEWIKEAKKRKLPNIEKSIYACRSIFSKKSVAVFNGVLNRRELESRYEVMAETYAYTINIEANLMIDLFRTMILPVAIKQQKELADSITSYSQVTKAGTKQQTKMLKELGKTIESAIKLVNELETICGKTASIQNNAKKAESYCDKVVPKCKELRAVVDKLETMIDDTLWHLPKYRELLFLV